MSLKKFHVFFIVISALLCAGMVFWGVYYYKTTAELSGFFFSALGLAGAVLLYRYLKYFLAKYSKILSLALVAGALISSLPTLAQACSTCFQDPDSPLTKGTMWGVWFLLVVIVGILMSIIFIARGWIKRSRTLAREL